jgi:hypothetical protein
MIPYLASLLGDRDNDSLAILTVLLVLLAGTRRMQSVLSILSPRILNCPIQRQQQL